VTGEDDVKGTNSFVGVTVDSGIEPSGIAGDGLNLAEEGPRVTLGLCSFPNSLRYDEVFARGSVDETRSSSLVWEKVLDYYDVRLEDWVED
jgi:hypothetical protein